MWLIDYIDAGTDLCSSMDLVEAGDGITLADMTFGASVTFTTHPTRCSYVVTVPLRGEIDIESPSGNVHATPELAAITNPPDPTTQTWSADADALWVRLHADIVSREAQYLERTACKALTLPSARNVTCAPALALSHGQGQEWLRHVLEFCHFLNHAPKGSDGRPDIERLPQHRLSNFRRRIVDLFLRAQDFDFVSS